MDLEDPVSPAPAGMIPVKGRGRSMRNMIKIKKMDDDVLPGARYHIF